MEGASPLAAASLPLPGTEQTDSFSPFFLAFSSRLSQQSRFSKTQRPYSAKDVCVLRGTVEMQYPSNQLGKKLVRSSPTFFPFPCFHFHPFNSQTIPEDQTLSSSACSTASSRPSSRTAKSATPTERSSLLPSLLPPPKDLPPLTLALFLLTGNRLDPVQVTQMAKHLETVYVSGWQSSSTASSTNEPGPDLAGPSFPSLASLARFRSNADCRLN